MMICVLLWTESLKAQATNPNFKYDIDRDKAEQVIDCFEERAMLRNSLNKCEGPDHSEAAIVGVLALITGIIIGANHH